MRVFRGLDILNPSSFFIILYVFYLLLAPLINEILKFSFDTEILPIDYNVKSLYILLVFLIFFVFSAYVLTPVLFNYKPLKNRGVTPNLNKKKALIVIILASIIVYLVHLYYFSKIGFLPLLHPDAGMVRVTAKKGYGGLLLLATGLAFTVTMISSVIYRRSNRLCKFILILNVVSLAVIVMLVGFRGPAAYLILIFFLSLYFTSDKYYSKFSIGLKWVFYGVLFLIILSLIDYLRYGNSFSISGLFQTFWTMTVNFYNFNMIYEYYSSHELLYGYSLITDFLVAVPGVPSEFMGVKLVNILNLSFDGEGMTVTAPGEAYLNFGVPGVLLYAILLGLTCELLHYYFTKSGTESAHIYLLFFSFSMSKISVAGIMPTVIFTIIPTVIMLLPLLMFVKGKSESTIYN